MQTRTYRAYSMAEALAAVRRDLGADAVIRTTRTYKRGGILGLWRKTVVEVTAERNAGQRQAKSQHATSPSQRQARQAYQSNGDQSSPSKRATGTNDAGAALRSSALRSRQDDQQRTKALALQMLRELEQKREDDARIDRVEFKLQHASSAMSETVTPSAAESSTSTSRPYESARAMNASDRPATTNEPDGTATATESVSQPPPATVVKTPVAQRFVITDPRRSTHGNATSHEPQNDTAEAVGSTNSTPSVGLGSGAGQSVETSRPTNQADDTLRTELSSLRAMVGQMLRRQSARGSDRPPGVPDGLFDMYLHMISQDLSDELADAVISAVRDELSSTDMEDDALVRDAVLRHLAEHIPVAECPVPLESPDERPLTIALIGPTGVGKTTTLAKLAASFKLRHQKSVGLITCDTYRIAAVDQLRTYANIIGLPLQVVLAPTEMQQALHALRECDVILIDTAGRSQKDVSRLTELREFLAQADPHEVHLVLSSTASEKVLLQEAEAFSRVGADKVVLTKLDEAVSFGMLVNVIRHLNRELSFFTTGQEVPDHIEIGRAERLAELMFDSVEQTH